MIQLKDKLKVNGGTRRYMEMIGLSLAFSLFAVSCTQDSDTFYPSSPEEEHPSVDESRMIPIQLSVDGVDQFYGGAVTRSGETVARLVQPLDSTYDTGYDVETTVESIPLENIMYSFVWWLTEQMLRLPIIMRGQLFIRQMVRESQLL